jgi:hypothetical protein
MIHALNSRQDIIYIYLSFIYHKMHISFIYICVSERYKSNTLFVLLLSINRKVYTLITPLLYARYTPMIPLSYPYYTLIIPLLYPYFTHIIPLLYPYYTPICITPGDQSKGIYTQMCMY